MKNLFKTIGIVALAAVIGCGVIACNNGNNGGGGGSNVSVAGTTWELKMTKAEFTAAQVKEGLSQEAAESSVALMEMMGVTFPVIVTRLVFDETTYTEYDVDPKTGENDEVVDTGAYTVEGKDIMSGGKKRCTVNGNKMTATKDGETYTFNKK